MTKKSNRTATIFRETFPNNNCHLQPGSAHFRAHERSCLPPRLHQLWHTGAVLHVFAIHIIPLVSIIIIIGTTMKRDLNIFTVSCFRLLMSKFFFRPVELLEIKARGRFGAVWKGQVWYSVFVFDYQNKIFSQTNLLLRLVKRWWQWRSSLSKTNRAGSLNRRSTTFPRCLLYIFLWCTWSLPNFDKLIKPNNFLLQNFSSSKKQPQD